MSARRLGPALLAAAALALIALSDPGRAQEREKGKSNLIDPRGEPEGFRPRLPMRYAVWHGAKGWHLRTTTAQVQHRFHGTVRVEGGTIEAVASVALEDKGKDDDRWRLNAARTELTFDFKTDRGVDGIDFQVSASAKKVRFDLSADGKRESEVIHIGHRGAHPQHMPFTFFAHPRAGEPLGFHSGEPMSYAVWHTGAVWHLRTSTAKKAHQFKGTVTVEGGTIEGIEAVRLEDKGRLEDRWRLSSNRRELTFDFKTERESDGIDLRVSKSAKRVRFDLKIDGKHHTERVFLGSDGSHPERVPFTLPTQAGKKK